jgi:AMMECR1 domain-containing protein
MHMMITDLIKSALNLQFKRDSSYSIPDHLFGVFSTVKRNNDIHGCIGYWELKGMSSQDIIDKAFSVTKSSFWEDTRRNNFNQEITKDPNALIEISFMKLPIYQVDEESGVFMKNNRKNTFNNKRYGLIVENDNKRATFLPGVFLDETFLNIKDKILNKANIITKSKSTFYAYECEIWESHLFVLLNQNKSNILQFVKFIDYVYKTFIPYEVSGSKIIINKNEDVRNLATIYDYLFFCKFLNRKENIKTLIHKNDLNYYIMKYNEHKTNMTQSSSFMFLSFHLMREKRTFVEHGVNHLYDILDSIDETDFELPQILICLTTIEPREKILINYMKSLTLKVERSDNIFFLNWFSKLLCVMIQNLHLRIPYSTCELLFSKMSQIINTFSSTTTETNYLAVSYEGCCALFLITKMYSIDKKYVDLNQAIFNYVFYLFIELQKRKNKYGLYAFLNGICRIDITTHVLYGHYYLLFK